MPSFESRDAKSLETMETAAFETQYSPRAIETATALAEVIVMILWWISLRLRFNIRLANAWHRKKVPRAFTSLHKS